MLEYLVDEEELNRIKWLRVVACEPWTDRQLGTLYLRLVEKEHRGVIDRIWTVRGISRPPIVIGLFVQQVTALRERGIRVVELDKELAKDYPELLMQTGFHPSPEGGDFYELTIW